MQSTLVKISVVAVIFHMTFGCGWHHGFNGHVCKSQCLASDCNLDDDSQPSCCGDDNHHDHDYNDASGHENELPINDDGEDDHACCVDDGCSATLQANFVFSHLDFSTQYLGGALSTSIAGSQRSYSLEMDPFPDLAHTITAARAHLLFGVQLI